MSSGHNSNSNFPPNPRLEVVPSAHQSYVQSMFSSIMSMARSILPLRSGDNVPRDFRPSDLAAVPPVSPDHTAITSFAYASNKVETLDLTAVLPASTSPRSHTANIVETSKNQVDTESSPVRQAIAGILACIHRYDSTPTSDSGVDQPELSGDSLVTTNSMRCSDYTGRYLYLSFVHSRN